MKRFFTFSLIALAIGFTGNALAAEKLVLGVSEEFSSKIDPSENRSAFHEVELEQDEFLSDQLEASVTLDGPDGKKVTVFASILNRRPYTSSVGLSVDGKLTNSSRTFLREDKADLPLLREGDNLENLTTVQRLLFDSEGITLGGHPVWRLELTYALYRKQVEDK